MMVKGFLHYLVRPDGATEYWIGWGDKDASPRTHFEAYLVVIAALLGYFIVYTFKSRIIPGVLGVLLSLICVYFGVSSEGRFALGCCLCGTAAVGVLFFVETGAYKKAYGKAILMLLGGVLVLLPVVYTLDLFGYREMYDESFMAGSGGFFTNTRFSLMLQQIKLFRYYPMGGCEVELVEYGGVHTGSAHNFWLDIGRAGGVVPCIMYAVFSITNIISLVKVSYYSRNINKYATIAAFIGAMLYFCLEPATFNKLFWCYIILVGGLLRGIVTDNRENSQNGVIINNSISL